MGYYIDTTVHKGKTEWILEHEPSAREIDLGEATRIATGEQTADPPEAVIIIIDNGPWEAAGYAITAGDSRIPVRTSVRP